MNWRDYVLVASATAATAVLSASHLSGLTEDTYWAGWSSGFATSTTFTLNMHAFARPVAWRARGELPGPD